MSAPHPNDEILTPVDVSAWTKTAVGTLAYWRHIGIGPAWFRLGRRVLYRRSAVQTWISEQEQAQHAATDRRRSGSGRRSA